MEQQRKKGVKEFVCEVTCEKGKQVFVVANEYGPQRGKGKMIDLDAVSYKKLAPLGKGVIEVKVEEILE